MVPLAFVVMHKLSIKQLSLIAILYWWLLPFQVVTRAPNWIWHMLICKYTPSARNTQLSMHTKVCTSTPDYLLELLQVLQSSKESLKTFSRVFLTHVFASMTLFWRARLRLSIFNNLAEVLTHLEKAGLYLKQEKCSEGTYVPLLIPHPQ